MRVSAVAVTVLSAALSVSASSLLARQNYPTCAVTCISSANLHGCIASDYHCLCTNNDFISETTQCIYAKCTGSDLTTAVALSQELCAKVGVTLTSQPAATGSKTGAASGSATAPASPAATKSGASTTSRNALVGLAIAALMAFSL